MVRKRRRDQRSTLEAVLRPLVLVVTWAILVPGLRLIEWLGGGPLLMRVVSSLVDPGWRAAWKGYRPTSRDVIVGSYLKSGTTWTLQIAVQTVNRGRVEFDHLHDLVPWPDEVKRGYAIDLEEAGPANASPTGLRVIKTHAPWDCIPYAPEAKYILVVRDPKDVFVSSYYFLRGALLGPLMPSVPSWYEHFLSPHFVAGAWAEHAHGYWDARALPNVLFLTFKELRADLRESVERVADFLEVSLTPDELSAVCEKSSFESMKRVDEKFAPGVVTPWSTAVPLVRSGRQGGSGELLSPAEQRRVDSTFRAALEALGSDLDWDAVCSPPMPEALDSERAS